MWTCPKCKEEVADQLSYCWNCGVNRSGEPLSDEARNLQQSLGRRFLSVDTRKGIFFCVIVALVGGFLFYLFRPAAPPFLSALIMKIQSTTAGKGINELVMILTKAPNCYILLGVLIGGLAGYIIDRLIGNGNSLLCKISHFLSVSDIDKPIAKQIILEGMSQAMVEKRIGFPLQIVNRESQEIYVYKFIKITFQNKKVIHID